MIRQNKYDLRLNEILSKCFSIRGQGPGFAFWAYEEKVTSQLFYKRLQTGDSRLLALPAELRERICEYALSCEETIAIRRPDYATSTALLRTCRQIRAEALPVFFKYNHFSVALGFKDWRNLFHWTLKVERADLATIRSFNIEFHDAETIRRLQTATSLDCENVQKTIGRIYQEQEELIARILSKLPFSGLRLSSISAPVVQMPRIEDGVGEYLLADIKDHWQKALARQVAALIAKAAQ